MGSFSPRLLVVFWFTCIVILPLGPSGCGGADVNVRDAKGFTPLHFAVLRGQLLVVARLIDAGADVNARTRDNITPLVFAAAGGHFPIVQLLIDAGADVNAETILGTPLDGAERNKHRDVADLLRKHGARPGR